MSSPSKAELMDIDQVPQQQEQVQVKSLDDDDHVPRMVMIKSKKNANSAPLLVNADLWMVHNDLVKTALENDRESNDLEFDISRDVLEMMNRWVEHFQTKLPEFPPKPLKDSYFESDANSAFVLPFFQEVQKRFLLQEMLTSSNYLDNKPLLHFCCAWVAKHIKGHPLEKLQSILSQLFTGSTAATTASSSSAAPVVPSSPQAVSC